MTKYRITGNESTGRLKEIIKKQNWEVAERNEKNLDFVWETASEGLRELHKNAKVAQFNNF